MHLITNISFLALKFMILLKNNLSLGRIDPGGERNVLVLRTNHSYDFQILSEVQFIDSFKALLQMRLDTKRIFCFGENLKKFII